MPNPPMVYSQTGEHLTEQFESCALVGYADIHGVPTVGWGHTGPNVTVGMVITQAQADAWLLEDILWAAEVVNRVVTVTLTQGEFDALTDFVFNDGSGNFESSTMLRLLNSGNYAGAAAQFDLWDHAGGQVVAGLLRRRQAETTEFDS